MSNAKRILLTAETVICLSPAILAIFLWTFMYVMPLLHGASDNGRTPHALMVGNILFGTAAIVAAFLMLGFILYGRRTIPRLLMLALAAGGLYITGRMMFDTLHDEGPLVFVVLPGAPFLCGVHLLWLGRKYFARDSETT